MKKGEETMREKLENVRLTWELEVTDRLESAYRTWKDKFITKFAEDEEGDSNMVAVIVLIVIIIAVAGVFRTSLMEAVTKIMEKLTEFIG
jgi:hypothetical protein